MMSILDCYVLKKFALPFVYCILGFIGIWFIFDLSDNLPDFLQGRATPDFLLAYYKSQIPEIIVISVPVATLLALLYSLTAMSRSNEIIAMLGAGRSVVSMIDLPPGRRVRRDCDVMLQRHFGEPDTDMLSFPETLPQ